MKLLAAIDRLPLTLISALMMGASVAFFCVAMPVAIIEQVAGAIRLSAILPAAAPPLGSTAQGLLAATGGIVAAVAAWLAVEFADDSPVPEVEEYIDLWAPPPAPPVTPRRPIFAQSELGTPIDQIETAAPEQLRPAEPMRPADPIPSAQPMRVEEIVTAEWFEIAPEPAGDADILELVDVVTGDAPVEESAESIRALAARFEAGLVRRAGGTPQPEPQPRDSTSALRDAIEELKRMATR